jgi:hypothetical protein
MDVRVICSLPACERPERDYVLVHTCSSPDDDTITLATIERVVDKTNGLAKRIKTLVARARMTAGEALSFATSYAERKQIPVVYADPD